VGLVNLAERYRLMWQREIIITQNDGIFRVEIFLKNDDSKIENQKFKNQK